jgi:UDP-GlcNAc3NAcA epimerase
MKKIVTVLGARPQFIKASVVSHAITQTPGLFEVIVHTGQHFDTNMSAVFFSELGMRAPDYFLNINSGSHGEMTGRMLAEVERVLLAENPDIVLVYGDTNSTLAGALAAVKLHIPVAHVEAGLRSFNMAMPEEVNRILTDRISHWLFAPTQTAVDNLIREGSRSESIYLVGDVMYDVALHHGGRVQPEGGLLSRLRLEPKGYVLTTIHRAENTDHSERLAAIVDALIATGKSFPVVWPLHPRTRAALIRLGKLGELESCVHVIDPVGYLDMVQLEKFAALIVTDSGGVQKEAFFYEVPCVTMRDETEWVELVEAGWNQLAPPLCSRHILEAIECSHSADRRRVNPFGSGDSAKKLTGILGSY